MENTNRNELGPQIAIRVPEWWLEKLDNEVQRLSGQLGTVMTRADIVRMALAKHLGLTTDTADAQ